MNQQFYGWKLVSVLWFVMMLAMGFVAYGGSIMNTFMVTELHLDRKSLGIATASFGVCLGLFSPLAGYCVNKWGARMTLSAGVLMAAIGALAMATVVDSIPGVLISYGLIMGCAGALAGSVSCNTMIGYWFRKRLALSLTIVATGGNIGGFLATPLLTKAIVEADGNWRTGWFIVAAVCAVAFLVAVLFTRNKPSDMGQLQDGGVEEDSQSEAKAGSKRASGVYRTNRDWTFREALRHPVFWVMLLGVAASTAPLGMMLGHGVAHFKDLGHSPAMAATFLSVLIFSGLGGKAIFAALGDRIEPRFIWSTGLIAIAIGMVMVVNARSAIELYACALLLGLASAIGTLSMFTLAVNYFGKTAYPSLMGVIGLFLALLPASMSVLTGVAFDHFGSYSTAFYAEAAFCTLLGLLMPFAVPSQQPAERLKVA